MCTKTKNVHFCDEWNNLGDSDEVSIWNKPVRRRHSPNKKHSWQISQDEKPDISNPHWAIGLNGRSAKVQPTKQTYKNTHLRFAHATQPNALSAPLNLINTTNAGSYFIQVLFSCELSLCVCVFFRVGRYARGTGIYHESFVLGGGKQPAFIRMEWQYSDGFVCTSLLLQVCPWGTGCSEHTNCVMNWKKYMRIVVYTFLLILFQNY